MMCLQFNFFSEQPIRLNKITKLEKGFYVYVVSIGEHTMFIPTDRGIFSNPHGKLITKSTEH